MTLGAAYWLVRSLRVGVEVTPGVVAVHGQLRTRRFALEDIRRARVAPMRTASPFYRLHKIERELLLLCHVDSTLGDTQLTQKLEDLDTRIAEGWRPEAADAGEFVAGLRQQLPS